MSVQRYVDTGFWDDAWVETIQPLERYLYLYLITVKAPDLPAAPEPRHAEDEYAARAQDAGREEP